jgi:hypothetical protein
MTVVDDVARLIARLAPKAICDDCITERLQLSGRQHAGHKSRELAGTLGFVRSKGECSLCGANKLVITQR